MYEPYPEEATAPANVEAERAALGSILIDPDAVVEVAELLSADDFCQERNGWIYRAILDLNARNVRADFLAAHGEAAGADGLQRAAGVGETDEVLA